MRHRFGGSPSDYAMEKVGLQLLLRPESEGTVWDAVEDGTQITDLTDLNGVPITEVVSDGDGAVAFYGPDSVTSLYVDFGYGRRYALVATDVGDIFTDFLAQGGEPSGWATLDGTGKVPSGQLPAPIGDWAKHVAAASATADEKARADWVCDGTADDVQVQAAIDAVKAAGGGQVVLSSGVFNLAARLLIEGADDVDIEIDIHLRGQGPKSTTLAAGAGLLSGIHLSKVIRVHASNFGITVSGGTHGISSATTNGASSGHRSFWDSSFKNLQINGPWDGSHSGWGLHLGSPFRSVFENVEMGGVGNGWRMFSEHADFNPGDCTVIRAFVDSSGDNMTAYQVDSTTASGVMNQIDFIRCEAIADGTGCTGIHLDGVGGWGTSHTHWQGINLEQFDKLIHVEYGSSNTFQLDHTNLRDGAAGLTAITFGANSFNNTVQAAGLFYATDTCKLYADGNTIEPASPNRVLNMRVYGDSGVKVTGSLNPAGTTVRSGLVGNTWAKSPPAPHVYVPPGWGKRWFAARDNAGSTPARIVMVGGSATAGFYASNPRTKSWPGIIASTLQAVYGDGGSGFQTTAMSPAILTGSDPTALAAWQTAGAVVGQTGTWTQGGSFYGPGGHYLYSDVTGNTLTFKARGTIVKIYTVVGSGTRPAMLYSIDGAADVSVAQPSGTAAIQVTTISGLSNAEHTVVVKVGTASAGQYLSVCGVSGEKTTGILVHNLAVAGSTSARYGTSYLAAGLNATYNGGVDFPGDLCIWSAGPNDASANNTADVWSANVARWIRAIRDNDPATGDVDLMFALPHFGRHEGTNFKYQDYVRAARGLCDVYGAAFVNWWGLGLNSWNNWNALGYWGTNAGTGATGTDSVHMSDTGFQYMADQLLPLLTN